MMRSCYHLQSAVEKQVTWRHEKLPVTTAVESKMFFCFIHRVQKLTQLQHFASEAHAVNKRNTVHEGFERHSEI